MKPYFKIYEQLETIDRDLYYYREIIADRNPTVYSSMLHIAWLFDQELHTSDAIYQLDVDPL